MKIPKVGEKVLVPMKVVAIDNERVSVSRFGVTWHLFWRNVLYIKEARGTATMSEHETLKALAEKIVNECNEKCGLVDLEGHNLGFNPDEAYSLVESLLAEAALVAAGPADNGNTVTVSGLSLNDAAYLLQYLKGLGYQCVKRTSAPEVKP